MMGTMMKKLLAVLLLAGLMLPACAQPSFADWQHDHPSPPNDHWRHQGPNHPAVRVADPWRGDIHRFHEHDFATWRGGRWWHGAHGGRLGWWWMVGDAWYFYPRPIYPYPYPYAPPVVVTPAPPAEYYYYCANPPGYYPYVPECFGPWSEVPH
jgi:hypothetical protein